MLSSLVRVGVGLGWVAVGVWGMGERGGRGGRWCCLAISRSRGPTLLRVVRSVSGVAGLDGVWGGGIRCVLPFLLFWKCGC